MASNRGGVYLEPNKVEVQSIDYPQLVLGDRDLQHGVTADSSGNIYVAEWLIGGRYIKLAAV